MQPRIILLEIYNRCKLLRMRCQRRERGRRLQCMQGNKRETSWNETPEEKGEMQDIQFNTREEVEIVKDRRLEKMCEAACKRRERVRNECRDYQLDVTETELQMSDTIRNTQRVRPSSSYGQISGD